MKNQKHKPDQLSQEEKCEIEIQRKEHNSSSDFWDILKHLFMWKESPEDKRKERN